ncbi:MAG: WecB/TagA/CpsF family glycosyltransferase, partial [Bacteroidota bacterium]|nr:WecB/TagA/CpsF family glycosyltransferase [Bacteroidota bacterium]
QNIQVKYPDLNIIGSRDGYFKDDEELMLHIKEIIKLNPEVIIVGMGSPLQENYLIKLKGAGWSGRGFSCGGFLHQSFQNTDYYPNWVNKLNIRWLYRICNEPKLIKRYTFDYSWFLVVFMYDWMKYTISK